MLHSFLLCLLTSSLVWATPNEVSGVIGQDVQEGETDRNGKFFPMVKIVSFENTPCVASSGLVGTCYSKKECGRLQGQAMGSCANKYGICCVVTATCDSMITLNNTYFQSPGFPATTSMGGRMCMVEMYLPKGTVQIKLDFLSFDILGPVDGYCGNDTFTISGANSGLTVPILCGYNSGQHLFIDVDNSNGPHKLIFNLGGISYDRNWNLLVSFLTNYDPCKAPPRCLQYYTDMSGTISSFNYGTYHPPQLINSLHYSICFAYIPGLCDIGLTFNNLDIGVLDETCGTCTEDYLAIQGIQICGTDTGVIVQANATGPIIIQVWTNDDNSVQQQGFSFTYSHMSC